MDQVDPINPDCSMKFLNPKVSSLSYMNVIYNCHIWKFFKSMLRNEKMIFISLIILIFVVLIAYYLIIWCKERIKRQIGMVDRELMCWLKNCFDVTIDIDFINNDVEVQISLAEI